MEKEKMKKVLMILLSAMLVLSMAGMVAASESKVITAVTENTATTTVNLGLKELYSVTIPTTITLEYDLSHDAYMGKSAFSIEILRLDTNRVLTVSVDSANNFQLKNGDAGINYKLGYGSEGQHIGASTNPAHSIVDESVFITTKEDVGIESAIYLHAKVDVTDTSSVQSNLNYEDTLTFTVQTIVP